MLLGELLIQKKLITQEELALALEEQKLSGEFLGTVLVRQRLVAEQDLVRVLAEQFEIPYVDLSQRYIDWNVATRFSSSLVTDRRCLPIAEDDQAILVAITNPLDAEAVSLVEREARGRRVKICLVRAKDMDEAIAQYQKRLAERTRKLLE